MNIIWKVISWEGEGRNKREKVQAIRDINYKYKIDRVRLRIV